MKDTKLKILPSCRLPPRRKQTAKKIFLQLMRIVQGAIFHVRLNFKSSSVSMGLEPALISLRMQSLERDQFQSCSASVPPFGMCIKGEWDWIGANELFEEDGRPTQVKTFLSNRHALSAWPSDTFIYHRFFVLDKLFAPTRLWFIST